MFYFQNSLIDNLKIMLWPPNETNYPFSFFNLKPSSELNFSDSIIYQLNPPGNCSMYLNAGSKSIKKIWIVSELLPLKIRQELYQFLWENHQMILSTGFYDWLYFPYNTTDSNPNRSMILSSSMKKIWVSMKFGLNPIIQPKVEILVWI